MGYRLASPPINKLNELFADPQIGHGPNPLVNFDSEQSLGPRFLEFVSLKPKPTLEPYSTTHKARVADCVRLGAFNAGVCFVCSTLFVKQPR